MTYKLLFRFFLAIVMAAGSGFSGAYSQFIEDDELYRDNLEKKEEKQDEKSLIPGYVAYNINAQRVPDIKNAIRVSWDVNSGYLDDYMVLRSPDVIDTSQKALKAKIVKTVKCELNNAIVDNDCPPGQYFYAVVMKKKYSGKGIDLFRDVNYMSAPVSIISADTAFVISNFKAVADGAGNVSLKWKRADRGGLIYNIYRGQSVIDSDIKLRTAEKISTMADIDDFIDGNIPSSGVYYYLVTARELNGKEGLVYMPDQNYNTIGVNVSVKGAGRYRPTAIDALQTDGGIALSWSYSGTAGARGFHVIRSTRALASINEITRGMIVGEADITAKRFSDRPATGEYYYALAPVSHTENRDYRFVPGVNITRTPVSGSNAYNNDSYRKDDDRGDQETVAGEVDDILKKTYFIGRYNLAIRSLKEYMRTAAGPAERAKAKLFIGRSYVEKKMFRRAMDYLAPEDVRKYFPREARFWYDYAAARIPSRKAGKR